MKKWLLPVVLVLLLAGCSQKAVPPQETPDAHADHGDHAIADLRETTASASVLPRFLDSQPEQVRTIYGIAGANAELLEYIPCFCGCGETAGHKNNKNCFIHSINKDGSVVWDDHGTRCGVCMEIAVVAAGMKHEGKSDLEIRNFIDESYSSGYGPSTDTPMPAM